MFIHVDPGYVNDEFTHIVSLSTAKMDIDHRNCLVVSNIFIVKHTWVIVIVFIFCLIPLPRD